MQAPSPFSGQRPSVAVGARPLRVRALDPLQLRLPWSHLRPVREHLRHRLPPRRRRPHLLGMCCLHARRWRAALPRMRAHWLERARDAVVAILGRLTLGARAIGAKMPAL